MMTRSYSIFTKAMVAFCLSSFVYSGLACTAISMTAKDGSVIAGRTMEWAFNMDWTLNIVPKGSPILLSAPAKQNLPSSQVNSKYAFAAIGPGILKGASAYLEGQNSAGLGISGNFLPGFTQYQVVNQGDQNYVSILNFGSFVLGMFSNVKDLKEQLPKYKVWFDPAEVAGLPTPPWLHFVFTDRTGSSLVVEFVKGEMVIYDNLANTLTNAPPFDWHLNNARNYMALSNTTPLPLTIKGKSITELGGEGGGMIGMPGDYTSPGRFIRAAYLQRMSSPAKNSAEAVQLVGHILNNVDVPIGTSLTVEGKSVISDYTQWVALKDLTNNQMKIANYGNRTNYVQIDLNQLFAANKPMSWLVDKLPYPSNDLTGQLLK